MKTKKGDFIEIEYVARTKDDNKVFDLTNKDKAKEFNLYNDKRDYSPIKICLGYNDIIPGLDEALTDKELGKYNIEIKSENAFGKKDHNLIKLVPNSVFIKQNVRPVHRLMVNIDGFIGIIKSAGSGRVLVDFNHPLAGRDLIYEVEIKRIINDVKEKLESFLNLVSKDIKFKLEKDKVIIDADKKIQDYIKEEIKKRIKEIKEIEFEKTTTGE